MMISSSSKAFFVLIVSFCVVEGTLTPDGTVSVDCGSTQTFTCRAPGVSIKWIITGLSGINIPGSFLARNAAMQPNSRITTTDTGGFMQVGVSVITISGYSISDNGGTIQCINNGTNNAIGIATISVVPLPLPPPINVATTVEPCNVTLQWDQPSEPNDITTSVSCTPPSPGCTECTTSPCTITGLNPSTEYVFAVTLNSEQCRTNISTTTTIDDRLPSCPSSVMAVSKGNNDAITVTWQQPPNTPPVTSTTVTYCPTSSTNCGNSMNCTSPCTISGLDPGTEYQFTVIPNNNVGSGCTGNMATAQTACKTSCSTCRAQSCPPAPLLAGIIPTVVLLLANVVTAVVTVLITRHCYKKTSQKSSPLNSKDVYDQVEGPKTCEDIVMTDSPAYGPLK